jgi:ankyrin repeat protein
MELLVKAGAPLDGVADWIVKEKDGAMASRLLAVNAHLSPADRAAIGQYAHPQDVDLPSAVSRDPTQVCGLIDTALENGNEARAIALTRYITPAAARTDVVRNTFLKALRFGSIKIVETLLNDGVSPDPAGYETAPGGLPPLQEAIGHPDIVLMLLHHGAHPRLLDRGDSLYIERVAASLSGTAVLPELLKDYPNLKTKHGYGTLGGTLLCAATGQWSDSSTYGALGETSDRIKTVEFLLSNGISINERGRDGFTAMHAACGWHDAEMACILAGHGADLKACDLAGRAVLDPPYISGGSYNGFLGRLQSYQPSSDIEKLGKERLLGAVAARPTLAQLVEAVNGNDLARVKELLNQGASLVPPYGRSFFNDKPSPGLVYLAVIHGNREMVETLLAHGCDPNIGVLGVYGWDYTPSLYYGGGKQNMDGLPTLPPRPRCKTPLIAAAEAGDLEMVKTLLSHGAYAPTQDESHRDAIEAAATPQIAEYIKINATAQYAAQELFDAIGNVSPEEGLALIHRIAGTAPKAFTARCPEGTTPLTYVYRGTSEMTESLTYSQIDTVALQDFCFGSAGMSCLG